MNNEDVLERVTEILNQSRVGVMSTVNDNKPNARYMIFYNDGLTLYTKTSDNTQKFDEIESNPNTHIMIGFNEGKHQAYLEISGTVETVTDQKTIDWLWSSQDKTYFDDKDDPDLVVLKVIPENIRMMNDDDIDVTEIEV